MRRGRGTPRIDQQGDAFGVEDGKVTPAAHCGARCAEKAVVFCDSPSFVSVARELLLRVDMNTQHPSQRIFLRRTRALLASAISLLAVPVLLGAPVGCASEPGAASKTDVNCSVGNTAAPKPLANEALGEPCDNTADCEAGLTCALTLGGYPSGPARSVTTCTQECTSSSCPTGSVCVDAPVGAGASLPKVCVPSCKSQADCAHLLGGASCSTAGVCAPLVCTSTAVSDEEGIACPTGYSCERADCKSKELGWCRKN